MSTTIKDGSSGFVAKVDEQLQLHVLAVNKSAEHDASERNSFTFFANTTDTANTLTATATGGAMLYVENTSGTQQLVIEKVLTSADTADGVVVWKRNNVVGTIGNNNTHAPVNLNFRSNVAAPVTCYNWDEVGDGMTGLSGGTTMKSFITGAGFTVHPIDGSIILGQGNSLTIEYKVAGGGEFECGIRMYFEALV